MLLDATARVEHRDEPAGLPGVKGYVGFKVAEGGPGVAPAV